MTQLGVQIWKTPFYWFSAKDICRVKPIGDTELIEKKWKAKIFLVTVSSNGEKMADTDTGFILDTVNTQSEDHEGSKTALLTNNSNSSSSPRFSKESF